MASRVKVSYANGRSVLVNTTPAMSLKAIVDSVCNQVKDLGDSNNYGLKWKNKELDLLLNVRFSNLPQGANLELVKVKLQKNSKVTVAFQCLDGKRVTSEFSPTITLKQIYEHSTSEKMENANPGLIMMIMNKQYIGFETFEKTTVQSIGFTSGSVLIKAMIASSATQNYVKPSTVLNSFQKAIKSTFAGIGTDPKKVETPKSISGSKISERKLEKEIKTEMNPNKNSKIDKGPRSDIIKEEKSSKDFIDKSKNDTKSDCKNESAINQEKVQHGVTRNAFLIPPSSNVPSLSSKTFDVPDSFYELTKEEVKALLKDHKNKEDHTTGFKTKAFRELEANRNLEKLKQTYKTVSDFNL
ncbi:hypothetical protein BB559_002200 [Furculomyces boomerangus]|uniref:TUG ubiquitin-like domain-containing protein n=1 Tax=Furculomyces boomerangus TaxID=61424 RepID=A0A2T9YX44_9FUNG|nr:hypothetical protein BB559_002200 [Furculomyces boomerangus]